MEGDWLLDSNILLRMTKSDDAHYGVIIAALAAVTRGHDEGASRYMTRGWRQACTYTPFRVC
jgi:hypothetical protein